MRRLVIDSVRVALLLVAVACTPTAVRAGEPAPFAARAGLVVATSAARAWAADAMLVYVENDEPLAEGGAAARWGYLFYSPAGEASRFYSVREGKIVAAGNLGMKFDAPPLSSSWLDSGQALAAAEAGPAVKVRAENPAATAGTMLLMRGAFAGDDPDRTTWTLVYRAPDVPALFVVVDATDGKVRRTWRG